MEGGASSIFHFSFLLIILVLLIPVRVRSCDFVDRSDLSAEQTIHEITRTNTK